MDDTFVHIDINNLIDLVEKVSNNYTKAENTEINIIIDNVLFYECVKKINSYLESLSSPPSEYKIGGALTFWIRKLKPLLFEPSNIDNNPDVYLNEKVAVVYGYNYIKASKNRQKLNFTKLSPKFLKDLAIQLRYASFSPSSIAFLFEAMDLK